MAQQTLAEAVANATAVLSAAGVPSPRVDAELLADHLLRVGLGRLRALMLGGTPEPTGYAALVARRAQRVPLQHLTGVAYFRYLELAVGPGVFIPRPETESVVQLAVDRLAELLDAAEQTPFSAPAPVVVDLGTGSGAIAGSLALEVPRARVFAVELGAEAYSFAERNLAPLPVTLVQGDLRTAFPELDGSADVVVSNPPYIPAGAVPREPEVANYDPHQALYGGGEDGMELPTAAATTAARLLKPGGYFVLEHAEVQSPQMAALLRESGCWSEVRTHPDLNGRDRATSAIRAADGSRDHGARDGGEGAGPDDERMAT
ncbi:peptide chain release factor N(5)-glutamine methyltransferase [Arthrobacter sp. H14-L1]|uniref:peptide chain release factor N(5)-glutamine methyltransferase n=1 Tax=Arthrobacter sp. H14-L1 TaxID=2996697 RepID=UPI00226F5F48|nr:peptide chain release factor N(5)-glutamine methyltransferase [Arthrobacter sp. H14-L1]MCY0905335.1 peptide chain release factor N(5)-glutamine methyltransferase [Arthrobacter sp. H14-L1]